MKIIIIFIVALTFLNAEVFKKSNGLSEFNVPNGTKVEVKESSLVSAANKNKTKEENFAKAKECDMNAKTNEERKNCWTTIKIPSINKPSYESVEKAFEGTEKFQKKTSLGKSLDKIDTSNFKDKLKKEDIEKLKYNLI